MCFVFGRGNYNSSNQGSKQEMNMNHDGGTYCMFLSMNTSVGFWKNVCCAAPLNVSLDTASLVWLILFLKFHACHDVLISFWLEVPAPGLKAIVQLSSVDMATFCFRNNVWLEFFFLKCVIR